MGKAIDFDQLWERHTNSRSVAAEITDGNRCALVLGMTLKSAFKPRTSKGEPLIPGRRFAS